MAEQAPVDNSATLWRPALAELIATMLFVFIGPCAVVVTGMITGGQMDTGRLLVISVAHGLAIAALATAIANISGGHINPAVTIAALVTGKIGGMRAVYYIIAQLVGAVIGSILLMIVVGPGTGLGGHAPNQAIGIPGGMIVEIILTFTLVFVIFAAAVDSRGLTHIATLAIGFTVLIDHLAGVPLTGASMNPARSFGPWVVGGMTPDFVTHLLVYWVAPILGGVIAALVYEHVYIKEIQEPAPPAPL